MIALFVSGDDFCALNFEEVFKGECVSQVSENLTETKERFLEKYPEYRDSLCLEVKDILINHESLKILKDHIGDYDYLKTENVYLEDHIF